MSPLLDQIIEAAPHMLRDLLNEAAGEIDEAISQAVVQAAAEETKPKFSLGYKISVDLDERSFDVILSWNEKHTYSQTVAFKDPNQPDLPLDGTVTIASPGHKPVTVTTEQLSKLANVAKRRRKE